MSPPLPQQNGRWIDPVWVRMGIVLGVYVCQGVYICICTQVCVCVCVCVCFHMCTWGYILYMHMEFYVCRFWADVSKELFCLMADQFLNGY